MFGGGGSLESGRVGRPFLLSQERSRPAKKKALLRCFCGRNSEAGLHSTPSGSQAQNVKEWRTTNPWAICQMLPAGTPKKRFGQGLGKVDPMDACHIGLGHCDEKTTTREERKRTGMKGISPLNFFLNAANPSLVNARLGWTQPKK